MYISGGALVWNLACVSARNESIGIEYNASAGIYVCMYICIHETKYEYVHMLMSVTENLQPNAGMYVFM